MTTSFLSLNRRRLMGTSLAMALTSLSGAAFAQSAVTATAEPEDQEGVRWVHLSSGHRVWTQRVGAGPIKILLLHGGPGFSHDYLECFKDYLPQAGCEVYFYDQLGCGLSDRPQDTSYWTVERYVHEVEEVRQALGLDQFVLYGHSWGGLLGIEYALRYQQHLSGFVLSNMTASIDDYTAYTQTLRAALPADVRQSLDDLEAAGLGESAEFNELVQTHLYTRHVLRLETWPEPVLRTLAKVNTTIYNQMQGANEFVVTGNLRGWDRWADLPRIGTKTLVMGADKDEMNPASIAREARLFPNGKLFMSGRGSHLAMWDDQANYFNGLLGFLKGLPA